MRTSAPMVRAAAGATLVIFRDLPLDLEGANPVKE